MGALCLTVPNFLFRVIFIPAYTNPDKKAYPQKMALTVPEPDYPDLIRSKDRNNAYSATNGSASGYRTQLMLDRPTGPQNKKDNGTTLPNTKSIAHKLK